MHIADKNRSTCLLLAGLSLAGCVGGGEGENLEERVTGALHANPNSVWTAKPGVTTPITIPVCWENYGASVVNTSTAEFRATVQDAIASTWQRYARINFTGWGTCPVPTQPVTPGTLGAAGIHIFMDPPTACPGGGSGAWCGGTGTPSGNTGGPATSGGPGAADGPQGYLDMDGRIATTAAATQAGMRLNPNMLAESGEDWTRRVAVHEFGHALGLYHEEQRTDTPSSLPGCATNFGGQKSGTRLGWYDNTSIMSYCSAPPFGRLAPNDIMGIQRIYGRRIAGEIVTRRGLCLTAKSTDTNPYLWTCDEPGADQVWRMDLSNYKLFRDYTTDKCLNAPSTADGTLITSPNCVGGATQEWRFKDIEIRGVGGKCLHHVGTGSQIQMATCRSEEVPSVSTTRDKWRVMSNGVIHLESNYDRCVTVTGSTDTSPIKLEACASPYPDNQKFTFHSDGTIRSVSTGKCLDVFGQLPSEYVNGVGAPGGLVQLYTCLSGAENLNQKWNFSGQIRLASDLTKCMDRPNSNDNMGVKPQVYTCWADPDDPFPSGEVDTSAHTSQQWDYYFKP
jgi:hypothetical protein